MKTKSFILLTILISLLTFGFLADLGVTSVYAGVRCRGTCHSCGPRATGDTSSCSSGDDGSYEVCCYDENCNGGCSNDSNAPCGNCDYFCDEETCECSPVSCPTSRPPTKYRQRSQSQGQGRSCGDPCNPNNYACEPTYVNSVPTCSMVPASISMNRSDPARQFNLTVTDADWGDTVKVTGVEVVDGAGNLKSCVNVTTLTGNSLGQLIVRPGTDNSSALSTTTTLLADASTAYGIFDDNGVCSGQIKIHITDTSPEATNIDVPAHVVCSVNITVTNDLPQISNLQIRDQDVISPLRRPGNLATQYRAGDGNGSLPVGSLWENRRVSRCTAPVDLSNNYGECYSWEPKATRTNPYAVTFTVSDAQGINDIKDIGLWIQRSDAAANPTIPLVSGTSRRSIQALVGQRENYQIGNPYYFTAAPCLGQSCTENITAQDLLGYTLITARGAYSAQGNGNISRSGKSASSYKEWLQKGFPNCLFQGTGVCDGTNVPTASNANATSDANVWANYDWTIAADQSHMMCLSSTENTTSVITKPSNGTCPSTCAACVALNSLTPNTTTPASAVDISFNVWMNDKYINGGNNNAGMEEGRYEVFVGARDTVAGNAYNANFWRTVGGNSNRFSLVFDAEPPTVSSFAMTLNTTTTVRASGALQDTRTGIAGWGNRFILMEDLSDLSKPKQYLTDASNAPWNGTDWPIQTGLTGTSTNKTFTYTGQGFSVGTPVGIMGGFCTYDNAGNMCCVQSVFSGSTTTAKKECANYSTPALLQVGVPWIQTTLGSVYSNTAANSTAFQMSSSAQARNLTDPATLDRIPTGIDQTQGVSLGGIFVTGGSSVGVSGAANNAPLGYNRDTRADTTTEIRNVFGVGDIEVRDWYAILSSLVRKNCSLSGDCYAPEGKTLQTIESEGTGYFEIGDVTQTQTLACNGKHVVFVKGKVVIGEITKSQKADGCLFVVARGASLKIEDTDIKAVTAFDRFDAAVVVSDGGTFESARSASFVRSSDRLQVFGFLYSDNTTAAPVLRRELDRNTTTDQNFYYPAEWFVYDADILGALRDLLGANRTADVVCGTSDHVLCSVSQ